MIFPSYAKKIDMELLFTLNRDGVKGEMTMITMMITMGGAGDPSQEAEEGHRSHHPILEESYWTAQSSSKLLWRAHQRYLKSHHCGRLSQCKLLLSDWSIVD